jgi:hypothetical protein
MGGQEVVLTPPHPPPSSSQREVFAGDVHDIPPPVSPHQGGGERFSEIASLHSP